MLIRLKKGSREILIEYLDQKEGYTVGAQRAGRFDVGNFGFDFQQSVVFLVLAKDLLLNAFDFHVRLRKKLFQTVEEEGKK